MKDFSPHAILRHPSTPDETEERLIKDSLISSKGEGPVVLLIEPPLPLTRKGGRLSHDSWPVSAKRAGLTFH